MIDQRSKSLSTRFLNTETESRGSGYVTTATVFFAQEHNGYCAFRNHLPFYTVEGARALHPDERLKDETDLSGISWALGTQ